MVDLGMMLDNLSDYGEEIERAKEKLEECVICTVNGRLHEQAGGLAVYYSISVQGSEELQTFVQLCPCNYYYALVDKMAYGAGTGSAQDYDNSSLLQDITDLAELFGFSAGGVMLPLELAESTDTCSIYACEIMLNGEYDTSLRIEYDWEYGEGSVIGIWDGIDPETGAASRDVYEQENGDVFEPVYYWTSLDDDTEEWYLGDACTVSGEVELEYDYLPAGYYFYSFELHDIYGNVYYTPYVTQEIDEEGNIWFYPEDMEDM